MTSNYQHSCIWASVSPATDIVHVTPVSSFVHLTSPLVFVRWLRMV
jgi:hypothetical protein